VLIWHRRARKTTTSIIELTRQALYKQGVYWHVFPTYSEAKDAVWRAPDMLFNIIPTELIRKKNEQDLVVEMVNGSILQLKGADNPARLLGAGPIGVVLDEFEEMKFETWQRVVEPILRANMGWCWFIGTPKGKNHLYQFYNLGQRENDEWKSWMLKASESGIIAKDQLENSRMTMTEALFRQEWECEFLEGEGSVFRNVRRACDSKPLTAIGEHLYVMGVDLAKVVDYTVVTVYDRNGNNQVYQEKFARLEWPFQKKKIQAISDAYNRALVYLDATGIGDPIADDLLRAGVPVEPVKITETSKKELIEKLSIWIEQQKLHMLYLTETLEEFDNFSYELGPTGRVRYGAREGFHDDIVLSHALACYGLQPVIKEPEPQIINPLHEYYKSIKQGGYETEEVIDELDEF
jgi:hypothetical protein